MLTLNIAIFNGITRQGKFLALGEFKLKNINLMHEKGSHLMNNYSPVTNLSPNL